MSRDKALIDKVTTNLEAVAGDFCDKFLNAEYRDLSARLIRKLSRKRNVPFLSGHLGIWAAGVIYALGQINFLFDPSVTPHVKAADLCKRMGTNPSNTAQQAKYIRNILKLRYFDPEFSTQAVRARDPYVQLSWSPLPPYVQEYRQIRRLQKDLQQEVINQHVTRPLINAAGRALGIMDDSGHLYLECPDDANIVMDFIIYETWDNASNAVQLYFNSHSNLSGAEREIMDGMLHARTSLYEIQYIDGIFLTLRDLLAEESSVARGDCPLADIGLSQSARPGTLLFIRVIPLGKVQITSGIIFPFADSYKLELLAAFDVQFQANASGAVDPIEKYAFFFKQHRKRGIPISYLDV